ncbi:MAG: lamin tail domain-containing protein, partial [Thermoplasmata archaeon]|nr:lamin tail domain-containing protein [Thermoplasmata archaeon]
IIMSAAQPVNAEMIPDDLSSGIQISEFLYDPSCPELDGEFIEIQNIALCPVNLLNWTLSDQDGDIDLFFPNIILHSGQMAVIFSGHGDLTIDQATGSYILHMNKSSSLLTNTGDDILLANATGSPMDFISFGDGSSTDLPPSGFNGSVPLSFIPEGMSYSRQGNNWSQSIPTPGSLPHSIDGILITGLCPDVKGGGEFIEITNPTAKAIDLAHCAITDGEGMAIFPSGTTIAPGESLAIADNGTRYHELTMEFPNLSYTGDSISGNMEIPGTRPMLANDGDEVFIIDAGLNKVDTLAYGDSIYLGEGWTGRPIMELDAYQIIRRVCLDGIYLDTDSVDDWNELKPLRMGQSNHTIQTIESSGNVGAFVSPDCSMEALLAEIEGASHSISLNVYEFTNRYLANALNDAMIRGVEVKILVDGSPVGGMSDAEVEALSFLANSGAEVHLMNPKDPKVESRYNFNHAKYLIIDDITSIIMTENWKMSGVPIEGTVGNRGWGVIIHDSEIAGYYSNLFSGDWNPAWEDVTIFEPLNVMDLPVWYGVDQTIVPIFEPTLSLTPSRITPVVYPDMSLGSDDPVLGMLDGAKSSILVEEFYIDLHWGARGIDGEWTQINPYLQAVVDAARRGCSVRILLDSTDYNIKFDDYNDNDNTVAYINSLADEEGLDMEAKLGRSGSHIFTKIHAKGLVVDGSKTLVSSINWNENSCTRNREVGVIVENQDIASYFTEVFNHDWQDFVQVSIPAPVIEASGTFTVNSTICFSAMNSTSASQIVNCSWDMNSDGVIDGFGADITWAYSCAGQYNITLTIEDENGTRNTATLMFNITSQLSL